MNAIITLQGINNTYNHTFSKDEMETVFGGRNFDEFQDQLIRIIKENNFRAIVKNTRGNEIFSLWANNTAEGIANHVESWKRLDAFVKSLAA